MPQEKTFSRLLHDSMKSEDTEEWLDVHFTRPIGLAFALVWQRLGVHPNTITILSIFLGAAAGYMFYFTDVAHNLCGIALLMLANFCDSTDGQLARMTGKKTLLGRVLDGFAGDVWFFCIYLAILLRWGNELFPHFGYPAYLVTFAVCFVASIVCHSRQSSLADYYRQIHLFFLLGREGSELDDSATQRQRYAAAQRSDVLARLFYYNYANYCASQERRTPQFQQFYSAVRRHWPDTADLPQPLRSEFRKGSLPLMKYANLLTFNSRAILIYITCLLDMPYVYLCLEMTIYVLLYIHMYRRHEYLCRHLYLKYCQDTPKQTT